MDARHVPVPDTNETADPGNVVRQVIEDLEQMRSLAERSGASLKLCRGNCETAPDQVRSAPTSTAQFLLKLRRKREIIFKDAGFGDGLFGEPIWDMLLELYLVHRHSKKISVSSLCYVSAVPATTALRHVRTLTELGLIERQSDPLDGRRIWVELSPAALHLIEELLSP